MKRRERIGIVTGTRAPQLSADGQALAAALEARGYRPEPAVWSDESVDWTGYEAVLCRSCWDYHTDPDGFRHLLETLEGADAQILNPVPTLRWNMHKTYLRDLRDAGVSMPSTAFVERESEAKLESILREHGWSEAVVKPAVGTSSAGTWRTSLETAADDQRRFEGLGADGDVLVQAFVPEIDEGERSCVFAGGEYSHAWNGIPAPGDFRSHYRFGGTIEPFEPSSETVDWAADVLRRGRDIVGVDAADLPYARVDFVVETDAHLLLELELIEPYLGLERGERATEIVCDAVVTRLEAGT